MALGKLDEARQYLTKAESKILPTSIDANTVRQKLDAERIADALILKTTKPDAAHAVRPPKEVLAFVVADVHPEQRFQVVMAHVNRWREKGQLAKAIELLISETSSPAYEPEDSAELKLQLATCYCDQASLHEESGNDAESRKSIATEGRVLQELLVQVRHLPGDSSRRHHFEGALHERLAELAHSADHRGPNQLPGDSSHAEALNAPAASHWRAAITSYRKLAEQRYSTDQASDANQLAPNVAQDSRHQAVQYRDIGLSGLQRAYESLRKLPGQNFNERLVDALCHVTDQLVAERSSRLLPTDPALHEAKRAQASIYASRDDRTSHERAAAIYGEMVSYWESRPQPQPASHAAALIGLAEMLRALGKTREAHQHALEANSLVATLPTTRDPASERERALLQARIENSLGITSIGLGEYRDALEHLTLADKKLKPYGDRAVELRRQNQRALLVLSRVKVYRALLHKAEAQFEHAANRVREGRRLREQLDEHVDLLAYYLAEAAVHLAHARALVEDEHLAAEAVAVRVSLESAKTALDRAEPLVQTNDNVGRSQQSAELPYRYLRCLLLRMRDDRDEAFKQFLELAEDCEKQGDAKTAAKSYMELAQLAAARIGVKSVGDNDTRNGDAREMSHDDVLALRQAKLHRIDSVTQAAGYAQRAVTIFRQLGDDENSADDESFRALPSLHFQAAYLAARLELVLMALEGHMTQVDALLANETASTSDASIASGDEDSTASNHRQRAIDLLEDAVHQAERPASSTTQVRLQRARFFSRYAPAYDLLVDLYVASAVGSAAAGTAQESSSEFSNLRRAIEVADLARNRTFREQVDGWRQLQGSARKPQTFDWQTQIQEVAAPGTALLIYHLDGPQLIEARGATSGGALSTIGGGHLFVVLNRGQELRYYRLQHNSPADASAVRFTRDMAARLVNRHIAWIGAPEAAPQWGRTEQRALTDCLLPRELLAGLLAAGSTSHDRQNDAAKDIRQLVIVPDGALHQLPFESLLLPKELASADRRVHYVIDDLPPIRYGPSLSVLASIANRQETSEDAANRLLTVGNPAYPPATQQAGIPAWKSLQRSFSDHQVVLANLTHSEAECNAAHASFDDSAAPSRVKLVQAAATEAEVRKHLSDSQFIHIAAHGWVDYQNDNLFGALIFAPGSDSSDPLDDGLLQLQDIYSIDLSRCDLAVLSACETYVGPERPLEAGTSMARTFLEQGANRVVCSQWATDDQATTDLMTAFFGSLRASREARHSVDYARALRDAKLAIRRDPNRGQMPKYWAPFVLVGAP